jgi:hypothetical protein
MAYTKDDELAINTIRILAASCPTKAAIDFALCFGGNQPPLPLA